MRIEETDDIDACRALRHAVFIEEQGIAEADEWDDLDGQAIHLLAWEEGEPVGTARILQSGTTGKIGRVCVLAKARGTGLGTKLIRAAVDVLRARPGVTHAKLGAQVHAIGFYEKLGFKVAGEVYDDAGIPHRDMIREL
ncbi:GNAT family N-acetyltransferase [Paracoccus saliphilus]|uniref:ElaA protein n=1 Tax=Paracoccus saliphilus TaxID=405559 RepID=A0AA45W2I6_9RHOB|nr:GNAT family N-acetyltransferase [Paracoccus saliphilus]WCR02037.1 GNAT family N-acetyltransferase [Paracoccus saliphilus]SIS66788.1 ElaA protein [Paracoccus saliphilus]